MGCHAGVDGGFDGFGFRAAFDAVSHGWMLMCLGGSCNDAALLLLMVVGESFVLRLNQGTTSRKVHARNGIDEDDWLCISRHRVMSLCQNDTAYPTHSINGIHLALTWM